MKKLIVASALAVFSTMSFAAATNVCDGLAASGNGTTINGGTAGTDFVLSTFTPKCSTNVFLAYDQNATVFAVASGSKKGKTYYSANTNGGGVTADGSCPATGCVKTDTETKVTAKLSASS